MFPNSPLYGADLDYAAPFAEKFAGAAILVTGATGLIGAFIVDTLMRQNRHGAGITVYALGRNEDAACSRFAEHWDSSHFHFVKHDIITLLDPAVFPAPVDFVIHCAANALPTLFSAAPVDTVVGVIIGARNVFDFAAAHGVKRAIFISSSEVYGENRGDCERFQEDYCGFIDCNSLRAGYPEGKRCAEALCQAYRREKGVNIVIARLGYIFGATQTATDSRVNAQFLRHAAARENIVLKSAGTQVRSYCCVADTTTALLTLLSKGEDGAAYNVANSAGDEMSIREIAEFLASESGAKVIYEAPTISEATSYSPRDRAVLDVGKIHGLGWQEKFTLRDGLRRACSILCDLM
jgi:nucleoside-diphosphate-sugar epimerase